MRYTRYNYKKNGMIKVICKTVVIIIVTVLGGLYVSSVIFQGNVIRSSSEVEESDTGNTNVDETDVNIIALQCGYFSKKENAEGVMSSVSKYCQPFIVEEDDKYRVIAGIYQEENGLEKIEEFKEQGIDVAKVSLNLDNSTDEDNKIKEIVSGFLEITKKLEDTSVKSVNTSEFKVWCENILGDNSDSGNEKINSIYNYINNLPDELQKDNVSKCEQDLYTIIQI